VDRGGTEGWPFTGTDSYVSDNSPGGDVSEGDGFQTWEDFSITSNFALEIPCVMFDGSSGDPDPDGYYGVPTQTGFDDDNCYSSIQGTSMAAPHASATLGLIASAHPELRFDPKGLINFLKKSAVTPAKMLTNATPPVSAKDTSNTDRGRRCLSRRLLPSVREGHQVQRCLRCRARRRGGCGRGR
jgi:subtilisin family serine protease